jgi:hypothetical protein
METHTTDDGADDVAHDLTLDGNAVAGILQELFAVEMTASPTQCANCGQDGHIGDLLAFTQAPGIVLRCPACQEVMIRIVRTPGATYFEARGAVYLRFENK